MRVNKKREADLEKVLVDRVTNLGGLAWKFTSPGTVGVPDRIILIRGKICFVEMKAPDQRMRRIQEWRKKQIEREGFDVYCLDSLEKIEKFIEEIIGGKPNAVPATHLSAESH